MKKIILIMVAVLFNFTLSILVHANYIGEIQATKVQYPIIIDGEEVDKDIPRVSIEDRIYLPIRAICEVIGFRIEWNEEGRVEIMTNKTDVENDRVEVGYYGVKGWTAEVLDFEITKETAVAIADDVFLKIGGKDFMTETNVGVDETDDGKCYSVYRHEEPNVPGGNISVIIRKSDGKILRVLLEE